MKRVIIVTVLFVVTISCFGQKTGKINIPKEIKLAIEKGRRTDSGIPGENYFVNNADYNIKAEFDPDSRILSGKEIIYYMNNSNDSLQSIIINLYQNILKKGNARDWDIEADHADLHDGVDISSVKYNGKEIGIKSDRVNYNRSVIQIELSPKLPPKSKGTLEIEWSFLFPETMQVRYGKFGEGTYLVAYWYPKIAVYDDIYGWDIFAYTGNQEFYNDFGDYNVEVTVPGDYNVWSSGILQNAEEIYLPKYTGRINRAKQSDEVVEIIDSNDRTVNKIMKPADKHVWKFRAKHRPDFAFAMSDNYLWNATSVQSGNQRVLIHNLYSPESNESNGYADLTKTAIKFFTEEIPAIPYPYKQVSVFQSTGMEFPGMAGSIVSPQKIWNINTVIHEVGHAYFPFQTGFNEQKYAWMDEGLMSFYPLLLVQKETSIPLLNYTIMAYNHIAGTIVDIPLMVPSMNISEWDTYTFHAYYRSTVAFNELYNYLGKKKFVEGLQLLNKNWKGKHPTPYDMFNCFNQVAGEDLSWFWQPWFFEFAYADLKVGEITELQDSIFIRIYNNGGLPVPIKLKVTYKNSEEKNVELKSDIWRKHNQTYDVLIPKGDIKSVALDTLTVPDATPANNVHIVKN